jgi:flagellar basal-body rod protein FlgF
VIYGLYLSAAGALCESARSDVIANNVANINTAGFKDDLAVIRARSAQAVEKPLPAFATPLDAMGGGALVSETRTRQVQGPLEVTNKPFDLAIDGPGFFQVSDGTSDYYTRTGSFTRDTAGRLVMQDGKTFLTDRGRAIVLPADGDVTVAEDGTISVDGSATGRIELAAFAQPQLLSKVGDNLYVNRGATAAAEGAGRIKQGAIEASNVSPAAELAKMITAQRGYDMNIQLLKLQDQSLSDLISIGRVNI